MRGKNRVYEKKQEWTRGSEGVVGIQLRPEELKQTVCGEGGGGGLAKEGETECGRAVSSSVFCCCCCFSGKESDSKRRNAFCCQNLNEQQ